MKTKSKRVSRINWFVHFPRAHGKEASKCGPDINWINAHDSLCQKHLKGLQSHPEFSNSHHNVEIFLNYFLKANQELLQIIFIYKPVLHFTARRKTSAEHPSQEVFKLRLLKLLGERSFTRANPTHCSLWKEVVNKSQSPGLLLAVVFPLNMRLMSFGLSLFSPRLVNWIDLPKEISSGVREKEWERKSMLPGMERRKKFSDHANLFVHYMP